MSNPDYDFYCYEPTKGELLSQSLQHEFKHIPKKCGMCGTIISFSQPGFIRSKVTSITTVRYKADGYRRP
jgi:hypothetical protein